MSLPHLYDDIHVIESNPALRSVDSLGDCFSFVLKPSKPVTNFFLALGQWAGGGEVWVQRLLSIGFHVGVAVLIALNLKKWAETHRPNWPRHFPWMVAGVFLVLPVHREALVVALFRMEILGAFFTLAAALAAQHGRFGLLFFSLGLAALSKEVYLVISPVTVLLFMGRFSKAVVVVQGFWALVLGILLFQDADSQYPYRDVIGSGVLERGLHLRLAASALLESIAKTLAGWDISIVRLRDRAGLGLGLGLSGAAAILAFAAGLLGWLVSLKAQWRLWAGIFAVPTLIYLAIPNINIGSEHYTYFAALGLVGMVLSGIWLLLPRRQIYAAFACVYALILSIGLARSVSHTGSRLDFYANEAELHPESPGIWSDLALALMEKSPSLAPEAEPFIARAKRLDPNHPGALSAQFFYYLHTNDREGAARALKALEPVYAERPKQMESFKKHYELLTSAIPDPGDTSPADRSSSEPR